jgi:hypothetical protein
MISVIVAVIAIGTIATIAIIALLVMAIVIPLSIVCFRKGLFIYLFYGAIVNPYMYVTFAGKKSQVFILLVKNVFT